MMETLNTYISSFKNMDFMKYISMDTWSQVDSKKLKWWALGLLVGVPISMKILELLIFIKEARTIVAEINKLPGLERHPLWGTKNIDLRSATKRLSRTLYMINEVKFYRVYTLMIGPFIGVVSLVHPDSIKQVMKTSIPKRLTGDLNSPYSLLLPWLGEGLLISSGDHWFRNRRLITPAFHFDILKGYIEIYNSEGNTMMEFFQEKALAKESVELFEYVSRCSLDIILKCAFSYEGNIQTSSEGIEYLHSVSTLCDLLVKRIQSPMLRLSPMLFDVSPLGRKTNKYCDMAHKVSEDIINKRKEILASNPGSMKTGKRLDFLDVLLSAKDDSGEGLSDIEIRHEVDTFLFEGHDTTTSGTSFILYNLAAHPEIQERARKEVDSLLDQRGPHEQDITGDDLNKMPFLTQCIKESLRLHPPVCTVMRQLDTETEVEGVALKPGTSVSLNIYGVHHNEQVWGTDHMEFKPERMHIDNTKDMDAYAFIPFAAGPRNCIGQSFAMNELKILTAKTLRRFILTVKPGYTPELYPTLVLKAKNGIWVDFKSRS